MPQTYQFYQLNQKQWKLRKMPFNYFSSCPFFNFSFPIDLTKFISFIKQKSIKTYPAMLYIVSKTANQIENFRYRIKNEKMVCYEQIDVGITLLLQNTEIKFRRLNSMNTFKKFSEEYENVKNNNLQENVDLGEDVIYTSCLPWVPFSGFSCDRNNANFCIPQILWGKIVNNTVTFSVQANHRVIDGYHIGMFYQRLQNNFNNCQEYLK